MVVNNPDDPNGSHAAFVDPAGRQFRQRVMVRLKDEARRPAEIERVLPSAIPSERMDSAGRPADVGKRRRCSEHGQPPPDD